MITGKNWQCGWITDYRWQGRLHIVLFTMSKTINSKCSGPKLHRYIWRQESSVNVMQWSQNVKISRLVQVYSIVGGKISIHILFVFISFHKKFLNPMKKLDETFKSDLILTLNFLWDSIGECTTHVECKRPLAFNCN